MARGRAGLSERGPVKTAPPFAKLGTAVVSKNLPWVA
jgi:hypothetical protein